MESKLSAFWVELVSLTPVVLLFSWPWISSLDLA